MMLPLESSVSKESPAKLNKAFWQKLPIDTLSEYVITLLPFFDLLFISILIPPIILNSNLISFSSSL